MADIDPRRAMAKRVREERRRIIVLVVKGHPGYTHKEILIALNAFHAQGKWPQAPWDNARQDPYDVGLRQMLQALEVLGRVVWLRDERRTARWYLPEQVSALARAMLPTAEAQEYLMPPALDFTRRTGMRMGFGIKHERRLGLLLRVIRVETPRGLIDFPAPDWETGLQTAAQELGLEELVTA